MRGCIGRLPVILWCRCRRSTVTRRPDVAPLRALNQQYTGPHMRPEDQMSGAATILVINQESNTVESSTLEGTTAFLRSKGWTALTARDPDSGLNLLRRADLVIACLRLHDRTAIKLVRRIRSVHGAGRIPILLVSPSSLDEGTLASLFDAGADDYIELQRP